MCHSLAYLNPDLFFIFPLLCSVLQQIWALQAAFPCSCKLAWMPVLFIKQELKAVWRMERREKAGYLASYSLPLLGNPSVTITLPMAPHFARQVCCGFRSFSLALCSLESNITASFLCQLKLMDSVSNCKKLTFPHHLLFGFSDIPSHGQQTMCIKFPLF